MRFCEIVVQINEYDTTQNKDIPIFLLGVVCDMMRYIYSVVYTVTI